MAEAQRQDESPLVFTSAAAGKVAELIEEMQTGSQTLKQQAYLERISAASP